MKFDLFISDYDRTLGGLPDNTVDSETVSAINEYEKKGGKFVICTGRMFTSIRNICLKVGLKGLVVAFQGAMIKDIDSGASILEGGLEPEIAGKVAGEFALEKDMDTVIYIGDTFYYEKRSKYVDAYENLLNIKGIKVNNLKDEILSQNRKVSKLCILGETERVYQISKTYNARYKGQGVLFNNGADCLTEAINPVYSKKSGVEFLANYYNVPYEKILTVGDSSNDIGLVEGDWYGVAVGDGKEELKRVAKEVTVPYKDRPVLHLLKKYCL